MRLPALSHPLLACAVVALCAAGCNDERVAARPAQQMSALDQLPDCEGIDVLSTYEARPAGIEDFYFVIDGARTVCQTDFDGLQALATRFDTATTDTSARMERLSSDPMPGRGTGTDSEPDGPLDSDPMPGHGTNPAAATIRLIATGAARQ
ncbi:MAG: hypothetical protein ABI321_10400 [Polyangia bacterium]